MSNHERESEAGLHTKFMSSIGSVREIDEVASSVELGEVEG